MIACTKGNVQSNLHTTVPFYFLIWRQFSDKLVFWVSCQGWGKHGDSCPIVEGLHLHTFKNAVKAVIALAFIEWEGAAKKL
jgi:hypothetical protein